MIFDHTFHILVRHVCQRHIVALQKGKTRIVVFKIQCFPHSLRHLVNETENTFVAAGTVIVHQSVFKLDPQILRVILIDLQQPFFPGRLGDQHLHILFLDHILIIKNIFYRFTVDLQQAISGFYPHLLCDAVRFYSFNQMPFLLLHELSYSCMLSDRKFFFF